MDVGVPQTARQIVTSGDKSEEIPRSLERSEVPLYFRQFRDASVLKKLAHARKGPLYQLIGRKAWYETADIIAWLEARKGAGPARPHTGMAAAASPKTPAAPKKQIGRPTKMEQYLRKLAEQ
jgi:hypothetical protein